jgi:septum site-determining protein MinC
MNSNFMVQEDQNSPVLPAETVQALTIKGVRDGLLVTIGEGDWLDLQAALLKQIEGRGAFFKGARMAVDVGNRILHAAELGSLRDRLSNYEVALWAVVSNSPVTETTAQVLGLATRLAAPKPERQVKVVDTNLSGEDAVFLQRTLRSGFRVASHGHVVVLGEVNPGAEIIADGNVIVWGRIRGSVQAGAAGNSDCVVCALEINPTQLRIGEVFYAPPAKRKKSGPEMVRLSQGQAVLEPWTLK